MLNGANFGPHSATHSGVCVAYRSRAPGSATAANASVVQRLTSLCPWWPVMPSGPNVITVSGATSAMIALT